MPFPDFSFMSRQTGRAYEQMGSGLVRALALFRKRREEEAKRQQILRGLGERFAPRAAVTTVQDTTTLPEVRSAPERAAAFEYEPGPELPSLANAAPRPRVTSRRVGRDRPTYPGGRAGLRRLVTPQPATPARPPSGVSARFTPAVPPPGPETTPAPQVVSPARRVTRPPRVVEGEVRAGRPGLLELAQHLELPQLQKLQYALVEQMLTPEELETIEVGEGPVLAFNPRTGEVDQLHPGMGAGGPATVKPGDYVRQPDGTYAQVGTPSDESLSTPEIAMMAAGGDPMRAIEILSAMNQLERDGYFTFEGFDPQTNRVLVGNARTGEVAWQPVPGGGPVTGRMGRSSAGEREAMAGIRESLDKIRLVKQLYRPEYVGAVEGRVGRIEEYIPGLGSEEESTFRTAVKDLAIEVRRAATGLQMSQYEIQDLMQALPDVTTDETTFLARIDYILRKLETKARERQAEFTRSGVARTPAGPRRPQAPSAPSGRITLDEFLKE